MLGFPREAEAQGPGLEVVVGPNPHIEEGRVDQVLDAFFRKQYLLHLAQAATGQEERDALLTQAGKIFCGVFFSGGGLAVSTQVGFAEELYKGRFFSDGTVNTVVGASGGSIVATHAVIGDFGAENIFPEVCDAGFVARLRDRPRGKPWQMLDYEPLLGVLRAHAVDREKLHASPVDVYTVTIELSQGKQPTLHAFNMKDVDDIEVVLGASSNIPILSQQGPTQLGGILHSDGGLLGYPLEIMDNLVPEGAEEVNWLIIDALPTSTTPRGDAIADLLHALGERVSHPAQRIGLMHGKVRADSRRAVYGRHWPGIGVPDTESYGIFSPLRFDVKPFTHEKGVITDAISASRESARERFSHHRHRWVTEVEIPSVQTA